MPTQISKPKQAQYKSDPNSISMAMGGAFRDADARRINIKQNTFV